MRLAAAWVLAALAAPLAAEPRAQERGDDWRAVATPADRKRLRDWRAAWMDAFAKLRASGQLAALAAQGALFDPDRAMTGAVPPAGDYRCRQFKLGGTAVASRDFAAMPWVRCRVDGTGFVKADGRQRPVGTLFDDSGSRGVFLGTLMLGDERRALAYGRDAGRDMAGVVERVDAARWRIVLPYPRFESTLDVIELIPAP